MQSVQMYPRESVKSFLVKKTVKELLPIAKELCIRGRHSLQKDILIDAMLQKLESEWHEQNQKFWEEKVAVEESYSITAEAAISSVASENVVTITSEKGDTDMEPNKAKYIDNIRIGTLIAFKVNNVKYLSGAVKEIHEDYYVVETKNGVKFYVKTENIAWVKTGDRWPKGVYNALKGVTNDNRGTD